MSTPPVDTSTAGEWTVEYIEGLAYLNTGDGIPLTYAPEAFAEKHNASLAVLREQLAVAQQSIKDTQVEWSASQRKQLERAIAAEKQLAKAEAALKQMRGALERKFVSTDGALFYCGLCGVNATTMADLDASHKDDCVLAIQPDSTALKTVIEAETAPLREVVDALWRWANTPLIGELRHRGDDRNRELGEIEQKYRALAASA